MARAVLPPPAPPVEAVCPAWFRPPGLMPLIVVQKAHSASSAQCPRPLPPCHPWAQAQPEPVMPHPPSAPVTWNRPPCPVFPGLIERPPPPRPPFFEVMERRVPRLPRAVFLFLCPPPRLRLRHQSRPPPCSPAPSSLPA